jgi:hypothetical protein
LIASVRCYLSPQVAACSENIAEVLLPSPMMWRRSSASFSIDLVPFTPLPKV